jgi:hypothetical protein
MRAHGQIVVEKTAWIPLIGSNAANGTRQVNHQVGLRRLIQETYVFLFPQIVIPAARREYLAAAPITQFPHDMPAQKAGAAGHRNPFVVPKTHAAILAVFRWFRTAGNHISRNSCSEAL